MGYAQDRRPFPLPGSQLQYGPDRPLRVLNIDLYLEPDLDRHSIDGTCTTRVEAVDEAVERITLDAVDMDILDVRSSNEELEYERRSGALTVHFKRPL
ncbi:MAG TPA: hypothetical protein VMD07_06955, partial [Candidatus Acidoferrales bacterium]|nr:hypothetical protein [Candidatus Acidoferrales bacterium]